MEAKTEINGFTQVQNYIIFDKRLSLKARCILIIILSKIGIKDWKVYIKELMKHSEKDGRTAFQSAMKELVKHEYLILTKVWDKDSKKLSGTRYVLGKSAKQLSKPTEKQTTGKPDGQKTGLHSNKENSNTEILNNIQQQQNGINAAADGNNIFFFFNDLISDLDWRSHFEKRVIGKCLVGKENFDFILLAFRASSLEKNKTYQTLKEVQLHFSNWYDKIKLKELLLSKINEQKRLQEILVKKADKITEGIDNVISKLKNKRFKNVEQVEEVIRLLPEKITLLQNIRDSLLGPKSKNGVETVIIDARKLKDKLEKGKAKEKLHLVCLSESVNEKSKVQ